MKILVNPQTAIRYADIDKIPGKYGKRPSSKEVKVHDKSNEAILLPLNWYIHFIPGHISTKEIHVYWQIPPLKSLSQSNHLLLICTFLLKKSPCFHEYFMVARRLVKKGGTFGKVKGTSRGPEALQSHLNDSYHTNVLCLP